MNTHDHAGQIYVTRISLWSKIQWSQLPHKKTCLWTGVGSVGVPAKFHPRNKTWRAAQQELPPARRPGGVDGFLDEFAAAPLNPALG